MLFVDCKDQQSRLSACLENRRWWTIGSDYDAFLKAGDLPMMVGIWHDGLTSATSA
jgi:hypothetical protein